MSKKTNPKRWRDLIRMRPRKIRSAEERALTLPPMPRGQQRLAMGVVFALGVGLTAFALSDPLGLFSDSNGRTRTAETVATTESLQQLYQCPMHPEVIEAEQGDCPICKMKLMPMDTPVAPAPTPAPEQLYQCPMHPEVIESEPGDCPICGMDLTPMKSPGSPTTDTPRDRRRASAPGVIVIDPVQVQNSGVVSEPALRGEIARTVRTVGILDFNAELITWVNTKFSGWIEKVHVNYVGQEVRAGDALFDVYSPELVTTQEEYLRALEYRSALAQSDRREASRQAESLLRSTYDRLTYWDISEDQIRKLAETHRVQRQLTVRAPVDGVVAEVMDEALEGMFIEAGMNLYKIADLSSVWVHADVYESDLAWVREDQPAEVSFRFESDRVFRGKILFLYPEVSQETRTLKICIQVPNEDNRLRAGMYTDVVIHGPPIFDAVLISDSAVLRSGERDLVFVDLGEGRFEPREVELGIRGEGNRVQITEGLAPGEAVVVQAQFMLDSESRVHEAIAKFRDRGTGGAHRHGE